MRENEPRLRPIQQNIGTLDVLSTLSLERDLLNRTLKTCMSKATSHSAQHSMKSLWIRIVHVGQARGRIRQGAQTLIPHLRIPSSDFHIFIV